MPANAEVGLVAATTEADRRGDGIKEWELDFGATPHMFHSRAGMVAYKKAPAETTAEVADGAILPLDRFGTIEVDLDQLGTTTKPMKRVDVAYVPRRPRILLSTRNGVER